MRPYIPRADKQQQISIVLISFCLPLFIQTMIDIGDIEELKLDLVLKYLGLSWRRHTHKLLKQVHWEGSQKIHPWTAYWTSSLHGHLGIRVRSYWWSGHPKKQNLTEEKIYHHKSYVCSIACSHMYNHMQSSESISKESTITLLYKWEDSVLEGQASILFS